MQDAEDFPDVLLFFKDFQVESGTLRAQCMMRTFHSETKDKSNTWK